jgi:hypothetical protein
MPTPMRSKVLIWDIRDLRNMEGSGPRSRRLVTGVARETVSLLREIFGQAILVMSGQCRKMYQNLDPKPE